MIHEKKLVFQLASPAQCFSSRQPWILVHRSASCVFPFCDTLILTLNRCVPKGWFNKINNSYFLIKEVKWKWLFPPLWGFWQWEHSDCSHSLCLCLDSCEGTSRFTQQWLLHHQCKRQHSGKGKCCFTITMKIVFHLATPLKKPQDCGPHFANHWCVVSPQSFRAERDFGDPLIHVSKVKSTVYKH